MHWHNLSIQLATRGVEQDVASRGCSDPQPAPSPILADLRADDKGGEAETWAPPGHPGIGPSADDPSLDPDCPSTGCRQMFMNYCNYPTCTKESLVVNRLLGSRLRGLGPEGAPGRPRLQGHTKHSFEHEDIARPACHLLLDCALSVRKKFPLLSHRIREVVPQALHQKFKTQAKGRDLDIKHGKRLCGRHGDHKLTLPHCHRGRRVSVRCTCEKYNSDLLVA